MSARPHEGVGLTRPHLTSKSPLSPNEERLMAKRKRDRSKLARPSPADVDPNVPVHDFFASIQFDTPGGLLSWRSWKPMGRIYPCRQMRPLLSTSSLWISNTAYGCKRASMPWLGWAKLRI